MKISIKIGDVVRLKSGGPNMTVGYTDVGDDSEDIGCFWFVGDNKMYDSFVRETLIFISQ
jgi:uncharacterized protein YodC (DUF2158 family)